MFVYLMCGPRQLLFFQCGPEMPKGWTPLLEASCEDCRYLEIMGFVLIRLEKNGVVLKIPNIDKGVK